MSDAGVNTTFTSDATQVIRDQAKVIRQQDEAIEKYRKLVTEAKKGGKERQKAEEDARKELEKFAAATMKVNRTPLERYKEEMFKLNTALKAGKIDQETFNRAAAQAKTAFKDAGGAAAKAGDQHKTAFGASAITRLGALVSVAASVKKSFDYLATSFAAANEEIDRMAAKQRESFGGLGELSQLAETPEQLQSLISEAKKTFAEGGAPTLGAAGELQFALESAGLGRYRAGVSQLQATGVVRDAKSMVDAAAALESALGRAETGEFTDIVSKAFGASKGAPARAEQILQAAALSGASAAALGMSDEELLAAVATVAKTTGSADTAGTQLQSLLKQIEKTGIGEGFLQGGKSLREQVQAIKSLESSGTELRDIIGDRMEAITGYRLLASGMDRFDANLREITDAERTDAFGRKVTLARTATPELAAEQLRRRTSARAELSAEQSATMRTVADALVEDLVADLRERGRGEFKIQEARKIFNRQRGRTSYSWLFGNDDETFIRRFGQFASEDTRVSMEAVGITIGRAAADEIRAAGAELRGAAAETGRDLTNAARANQAAVGGAVEAH